MQTLATHKCGTCYFFQEAGFAGNGWCLHADRAKSAEVRALVRRNELACRNDWGQSLWTDKAVGAETGASRKLISAQAERPATEGEIGFMVKNRDGQVDPRRNVVPDDDTVASPAGEDVVLGQFSVMPSGHTGTRRLVDQVPADIAPRERRQPIAPSDERWQDAPEPGEPRGRVSEPEIPDPAIETREAIRRARDQFRHRSVSPDRFGPQGAVERPVMAERSEQGRTDEPLLTPDLAGFPEDARRAASRPAASVPSSAAESPDRRAPNQPWADTEDDLSTGQFGSDRTRAPRRAPIPGPVPARELRRDVRPRPSSVGSSPDGQDPAPIERDDERSRLRHAAPAGKRLPEVQLDAGQGDTPRAANRRSLPDLSDDFFTRGVIEPSQPPRHAERNAPVDAGRLHSTELDQSPQRPAEPRRPAQSERPIMAARESPPPTMDQDGEAPAAHVSRPRPAIPTPPVERRRPVPPPVRTVPTVAEVSRAYQATSGPRPATPRVRGIGQPPGQPERTPDTGHRPEDLWHSPPDSDDDRFDREPGSAEPQPPASLRPQPADFGDYGGWFDLQSVEPRLSPSLQRACATCRDFRASENGERGWCTNRDAFTLRTVVNASDLPCISSFGCWWVPYDAVWLAEASVRDHHNPTPLLDQLVPSEETLVSSRQRRRF